MKLFRTGLSACLIIASQYALVGCSQSTVTDNNTKKVILDDAQDRLSIYKPVELKPDLSSLSVNQRKMVSLLIDASVIMDNLYWQQALGENKDTFLSSIDDAKVQEFAQINYGPWDRLEGDTPFLTNTPEKPLGAQFYPKDMTKEELEVSTMRDKSGLYSVVQRDTNNNLVTIPYSEFYNDELTRAATLLKQASELAEDPSFVSYLNMRAEALITDQYQPSDLAWMDMKSNPIELVIGPIETYEDQLFGYRAAFESFVLLKDLAWSERLAKFATFLPELQENLPVEDKYKKEKPGANADLNAYDVIYSSGHGNAGSKTIAINLPNDEHVQLTKGTRRLQLKNAMRAKFDNIMLPITQQLIVPEQRNNVTFTAFFANTMFHEVAHGLGIKNTIDGSATVRQALKEHASALEEGKADILGLYMITQLLEQGVIEEGKLQDYYVTFMASIFRSVRFGAASAHGKANMIRFNFFSEKGAFSRNSVGQYEINMEKMQLAMRDLSSLILKLQGDGDYEGVASLVAEKGIIKPDLAKSLQQLTKAKIPVDITYIQGKKVLGLD
jgi:uncharacterized protein YcfL